MLMVLVSEASAVAIGFAVAAALAAGGSARAASGSAIAASSRPIAKPASAMIRDRAVAKTVIGWASACGFIAEPSPFVAFAGMNESVDMMIMWGGRRGQGTPASAFFSALCSALASLIIFWRQPAQALEPAAEQLPEPLLPTYSTLCARDAQLVFLGEISLSRSSCGMR